MRKHGAPAKRCGRDRRQHADLRDAGSGITVAIPHKPTIGILLDRLSPRAQAAGAVNLVRLEPDGTLFGDIVDGVGFVHGLEWPHQ